MSNLLNIDSSIPQVYDKKLLSIRLYGNKIWCRKLIRIFNMYHKIYKKFAQI